MILVRLVFALVERYLDDIILFLSEFPLMGRSAGMVELADTSDLGSDELRSWRFESSYPYFYNSLRESSRRIFSV